MTNPLSQVEHTSSALVGFMATATCPNLPMANGFVGGTWMFLSAKAQHGARQMRLLMFCGVLAA